MFASFLFGWMMMLVVCRCLEARLPNRVCCIHELKRNRKLLSTAVVNVVFIRHIIWGGERRVPSCHACANAALLVCIIDLQVITQF